jgi:hypothetical protein
MNSRNHKYNQYSINPSYANTQNTHPKYKMGNNSRMVLHHFVYVSKVKTVIHDYYILVAGLLNSHVYITCWGIWQHSWLRHYATSQKVVGSIPDEVTEFLNWYDPSSYTMALGLTQPLTEMSITNLPGVKGDQCVRPTTPLPSVSRTSRKCGSIYGLLEG